MSRAKLPQSRPVVPGASNVRSLFPAWTGAPPSVRHVALIGTFGPRKCGIATFTTDIFEKLAQYHPGIRVDVYALDDPLHPHVYANVAGIIDCTDPASYAGAAEAINNSGAEAVWLQHEYGIFGGDDGELVRGFVDRLAAPLILTPHTVLRDPSQRQRAILTHLIARASQTMVMSRHSRDLLAEHYGAPNELLTVIPHGAPDRPFGRQAEFKARLGLTGRTVLMTFGLIGPGKGLERVIEALPRIVEHHPQVIYRVVGATHPNLVARDGEAYRETLQARAAELGVADHVQWDNRFVESSELLDQIEACDIYLTPYGNLQQSTSGTLSYAVALGKAVVSTPYLHALELLDEGAGCLIEPNSSDAIAEVVLHLLSDPGALETLQRKAYAAGRETIWPRFAERAAALVESACARVKRPGPLTGPPSLAAVTAMTDGTGMLQHAIGVVPDRRHGYCLDDNARALMLMNLAPGLHPQEQMRLSQVYASFVQHAWNDGQQAFRNFMSFDRQWCEEQGSEDSNGRALWALGHTLAHAPDGGLRDWARQWYDTALPAIARMESPRTIAFTVLGACERLRVQPDHGLSRSVAQQGADVLSRLLDAARRPDWAWFETVLGYDNPRLSQALIAAGLALRSATFLRQGLDSLDWIAQQQISAAGHFRPIGSNSFGHELTHLPFDQQPLEAQAAIEAAGAAYAATGEGRWRSHALAAWNWFFGTNDRGAVLADMASGRCLDGINPHGANQNCGAESILAFQLAHYSMLALAPLSRGESAEAANGQHHDRVEVTLATP